MSDPSSPDRTQRKGRGALSNPAIRYEPTRVEAVDDGWGGIDEPLPALETTVGIDQARRMIAWNRSPDVPFDRSINPYRGCEHGCIYCFARPTHARYGLSPGQDFESRLLRKADAGARLRAELEHPHYRPAPITLGANTDPYQPIERRYRVTREILEVLAEYRHPVSIITKGSGIERDLDLLAAMADWNGVSVMVSLTSLDPSIKRTLEPRAAGPRRRLQLIRELTAAGIPTGTLIAPVVPAITDHELEALLTAAAEAGAVSAGYILLRLPQEVHGLFVDWLHAHYPDRAEHVLSLLRQAHGGREYDGRFGHRMRGSGAYAQILADRFRVACRRAGIDRQRRITLSSESFRRPPRAGDQADLFG
ncbi:MAG: PA0069 family radical SAM protein [Halofilum sp. (in: g-proteobacteria)]|nr:PA0069 family radical SAM protein [Halofilum sp. (in: g-proteobacteria)]